MSDDLKALMKSALADYERAGVDGSEGARAMRGAINHIAELEAKLAKAAGVLRDTATILEELADGYEFWIQDRDYHNLLRLIHSTRATLAELEGKTDG